MLDILKFLKNKRTASLRIFFNFCTHFFRWAKNVSRKKAIISSLSLLCIVSIGVFAFFLPTNAVGEEVGLKVSNSFWEGGLKYLANGLIFGLTYIFLGLAKLGISLTLFFLKFFIELAAYNGFIDAPPVVIGWYMVRDLANMFFVVALLIIAFATILGLEHYEWRHSLVKLTLAAILINFSRMILGLIIDVAHVFTITFLNVVSGAAAGNMIRMLNLDSILQLVRSTGPGGFSLGDDINIELFIASVMALVFAAMAALVIFWYTMTLVARVVVLWVLIVLSPLAFMMSAIPQLESYAHEFWEMFVKHVVVAPVMVFFLWLAFASLGNGEINNAVNIRFYDEDEIRAKELVNVQVPRAALTDAATWENMSSFILAIAFLFVGIEMVGRTGATAADLAGDAADFGKRVATIASGLAVARWTKDTASEKGSEAIKGATGMVVRPIQRFGEKQLAKAQALKSKADIWRDEKGTEFEKWAKEKGGTVGLMAASALTGSTMLFKSGTRKDEELEDWQERAEALKHRHEKSISTSYTRGGEEKLRANVELEFQEHLKEASRDEKIVRMRETLLGEARYSGMETKTLEKRADEEIIKEKLTAHEEAEKEQIRRATRGTPTGRVSLEDAARNKATAENIKEENELRRQEELLNARAAEFERGGQYVKAGQMRLQANSLRFNKAQEAFKAGNLNANERANLAGGLVTQISALRGVVGRTPAQELQLQSLIEQKAALTAVNAASGAYDAEQDERVSLGALRTAAGTPAWTEEWTRENQLRRFLSAQLGRVVAVGGEQAAWTEFENVVGREPGRVGPNPEKVQAVLRQFGVFGKNQIAQGNIGFAGLVREDIDARGQTVYAAPANLGNPGAHATEMVNTVQNWLNAGDIKIGQMKQAFGSRRADGLQLTRINADEARLNAALISGATAQRIATLDFGVFGDIDSSTVDVDDLRAQLEAFARSVKDRDAFDGVVKKLTNVIRDTGLEGNIAEMTRIRNLANARIP